jgi:hypothetical protein
MFRWPLAGWGSPAFALPDQAIIASEMDTVAVDQVERLGGCDWSSAAGAKIVGHSLAMPHMPGVLDEPPGEPGGFLGGMRRVAAVECLAVTGAPDLRRVLQRDRAGQRRHHLGLVLADLFEQTGRRLPLELDVQHIPLDHQLEVSGRGIARAAGRRWRSHRDAPPLRAVGWNRLRVFGALPGGQCDALVTTVPWRPGGVLTVKNPPSLSGRQAADRVAGIA